MSHTGEPCEERESQGGGVQLLLSGGDERSEPESLIKFPPTDTAAHGRTNGETGGGAGRSPAPPPSPLPCLFVTTASKEKEKEENRPLPGPRKKQADALTENIKWLAKTFGNHRIGFFTLTVGDREAGGRFRNLRDRKRAQTRFHSLLTNIIAQRYQCGVIAIERHQNGGIHFHLVVVCREDIHGEIDFAACFPPKDFFGKPTYKPDYTTANTAIKSEWAFWRHTAKLYGFGRHQLQPMRENGEALGRYLGEYLSKDWKQRLPEDKGARCVRYFGHWSTAQRQPKKRPTAPPVKSVFGWMTPRARAWREMVKQVMLVLKYKGTEITEENIKEIAGSKWAWRMGKLFEAVRFEIGDWQDEAVRAAIAEHNFQVQVRWLASGGDPARSCWWHITEIMLDHLRPSPEWKKQGDELQLAKDCEAAIRKGLKALAKRKAHQAEQRRLLGEVADSFQAERLKAGATSPATCVERPASV